MVNQQVFRATDCFDFDHNVYVTKFQPKVICFPQVNRGLLVDCNEEWNCNLPITGDQRYYNPIPTDGTIMLQTNFFDDVSADRTNPSSGWGTWVFAEIKDTDGTVVETNLANIASQYVVGWTGKESYQTIELDASLILEDCFSVRLYTSDGQESCTQHFKKSTCDTLVTLEGVHTKYDCWSNWHAVGEGFSGTSNFVYRNKVYIEADVKYYGSEVDVTDESDIVTRSEVNEYYRVFPRKSIPPYLMKYIVNKIMNANSILVNSESYVNSGISRTSPSEKTSMFLPVLEFRLPYCDIKNSCA